MVTGMELLHQTDVTRAENTIRRLECDRAELMAALRKCIGETVVILTADGRMSVEFAHQLQSIRDAEQLLSKIESK